MVKGTHNFTLRTIAKISAVLEEPIIEVAGEHKTNNEYVFINLIDSSPKTNISNRSNRFPYEIIQIILQYCGIIFRSAQRIMI